jgi:hypothetical protein
MISKALNAVRAFVGGVRALFHVLYHTPHGC